MKILYPNPTIRMVTVEIGTALSKEIEVIVMNIAGAEVFRKTDRSRDSVLFNLSEQVSGMYLVVLKQGDKTAIKKLILDRE